MAIAPPPPLSSSTRVLAWAQLGDETLARRAAAGNDAAFTALYERYHGPLLAYCRSILLDVEDADDAAQSALENALRALPARDVGRPLRPWLYRIAHNEAVTVLRRRRPHEELRDDNGPQVSGPEVQAEQRGRLEQLVEDLRSLPERQRGALVMRELNGLSYEEIGGALGLTEANARRAVFDARSALHDVADGRNADCVAIRRTLSDGDRRSIRARSIRAHLRSCDGCQTFQLGIRARRVELPALAPWLSGAAAASALGLGSMGGGGALVTVGGGGFWAALPAGAKSLAVVAAFATGGTAATIEIKQVTQPDRSLARQQAAASADSPEVRRAKLAAANAANARASARLARRERAAYRAQSSGAAERLTLAQQHGELTLKAPKPMSVGRPTPPPPAAKLPVSSPTRPPAPKPPVAGKTPEQIAAAQKIQQIQAQIQAAIAKAQAAAAAGTPGALLDANALVANTIDSVQSMLGDVLSSIGMSVPSSVANATAYAPTRTSTP